MTVFLKVSDENTDRRHALKFLFTSWGVNNVVRFSSGLLGVGLRHADAARGKTGILSGNALCTLTPPVT
jgi:hypothetical protein